MLGSPMVAKATVCAPAAKACATRSPAASQAPSRARFVGQREDQPGRLAGDVGQHDALGAADLARVGHRHEDHVGVAQDPDAADGDQLGIARADSDSVEDGVRHASCRASSHQIAGELGAAGPVQVEVGRVDASRGEAFGCAVGEQVGAVASRRRACSVVRWNSWAATGGAVGPGWRRDSRG